MLYNKIHTVKPYSVNPNQDFMWVAEYLNGTLSHEFEHEKFMVDRQKLLNFGLVGLGLMVYYDVATGIFHFDGKNYEIVYKTNEGEEYDLTNQFVLYNDCIHYHRYYSDMNGINAGKTYLCGYQLGYKVKLNIKDVKFFFQPLFVINENEPFKLRIRLVADKDLNGELIIKRSGQVVDTLKFDLGKNIGNQKEWLIY